MRDLLSLRSQRSDLVEHIDQLIHDAFVRPVSMLVLDMSGFSRITACHGVVHFLEMIYRMEQAACPAISANGGEVVKQEADNLFAIFQHPQQAVEAALDIQRATAAMNVVQAPESAIHVSIGIGYGPTLVISGKDMFGHEMNLACKLGEDIAQANEILLTQAACDALEATQYMLEPGAMQVGGLDITAYRWQGSIHARPLPDAPLAQA